VLDKLTYAGNLENLASIASDPRFEFVRGDVCDRDLLTNKRAGGDSGRLGRKTRERAR